MNPATATGEFNDEPDPPNGSLPTVLDLSHLEETLGLEQQIDPPRFDIENIQACVCRDVTGDREAVAKHHQDLFAERYAADVSILESSAQIVAETIADTAHEVIALNRKRAQLEPFLPELQRGLPWTTFDVVQVAMFCTIASAALFIGWQLLAVILMNSGIEQFEDPTRARTFSLVPLAASFLWKAVASLLGPAARGRYLGFIWLTGIALCAWWVVLFAQTFGDGFQSASQVDIGAILNTKTTKESESSGTTLMIVGLIAESLIAAGAWLYADNLIGKHRYFKPVANPMYSAYTKELTKLTAHRAEAQRVAVRIAAKLEMFAHARDVFVTRAVDVHDLGVVSKTNSALIASALGPAVQELRRANDEQPKPRPQQGVSDEVRLKSRDRRSPDDSLRERPDNVRRWTTDGDVGTVGKNGAGVGSEAPAGG